RPGRVAAGREQTGNAPAAARGETARAALLAHVVERVLRERLDVNRERGVVEIHRPTARFLDASAHFTLDLRRRQREALVGAARRNAERRRLDIAEVGENRSRDDV